MAVKIYPNRLLQCLFFVFCLGLWGCSSGVRSEHVQAVQKPFGVQKSYPTSTIYAYKARDIDGRSIALSRYEGKVLLVVNVASECRFTYQYGNLQRLYMRYRDQGLVVLGFPANDFGSQEPGTNAEIKEYVADQFHILFPLFSKISVKGEDMHPVYRCLTSPETSGKFGGPVTWNFNKFLIDRNGKTIARFPSEVDPLDPQITSAIEAALH